MKDHTVIARISAEGYEKLKRDALSANLSNSDYIRSLIYGTTPTAENHQQEIVSLLCKLYVHLSELGLDEDESLMEELNNLCQILS